MKRHFVFPPHFAGWFELGGQGQSQRDTGPSTPAAVRCPRKKLVLDMVFRDQEGQNNPGS